MLVKFFWNPIQRGVDEEGIPNYVDVPFVTIARDITNTVVREADEEDFERFPDEWKYFQKSTAKYEPLESGLPLEMWPVASPAEVENLKARGFRTVQDVAKMSADQQHRAPAFIGSLVINAKNYMKIAGEANLATQAMTNLLDENKTLRDELGLARGELTALRRQVAEKAA